MSYATFHVSCVKYIYIYIFFLLVELVGLGSVIKGAYPALLSLPITIAAHQPAPAQRDEDASHRWMS